MQFVRYRFHLAEQGGQKHFINYFLDWICILFIRLYCSPAKGKFGLAILCISNVGGVWLAFCNFRELHKLFLPLRNIFVVVLVLIVL